MSKEELFWDWIWDYIKSRFIFFEKEFQGNYESAHTHPDKIQFPELENRLYEYSSKLCFIIRKNESGMNELIISTGGDADYFSVAEKLVKKAPFILGWKFIALKPPGGFDYIFEKDGIKLDLKTSMFMQIEVPTKPELMGFRILLPNYKEIQDLPFEYYMFEILEAGLGEKIYAEKIDYIEYGQVPELDKRNNCRFLSELLPFLQSDK